MPGRAISISPAARSALILLVLTVLIALIFARYHDTWAGGGANKTATFIVLAMMMAGAWAARYGSIELLQAALALMPANADANANANANANARNVPFLIVATGICLIVVALWVLDGFPNSGDEYAYVLQAQTYAQGRLWAPAPTDPEPFLLLRFLEKDGIWVSQYQPGWALVLTPFAALGLPLWLANPILGAAMIGVFFALARQSVSVEAALLATLALASSAFFLLNFGSYFSHGLGALLAVAAVLAANNYIKHGRLTDALIAGACVGFIGFSRAFNALIIIMPILLFVLATPRRRIGLIWFGLGGLPFLAALLFYNAAITGDPLLPVAMWVLPGGEPLGAPTSQFLEQTFQRLRSLFFWTSPFLLVAWIAAFPILAKARKLDLTDCIAPTTIIFFLFYGGVGGNQYGPRYYFEALPFMVLTVAKLLDPLLFANDAKPSRSVQGLAAAAVLASFAYQVGFAIPRLALEHRIVVERQEVYRLAEAQRLANAVVLIAEDTSPTRLMLPEDLIRNGLVIGDETVTYARDMGNLNSRLFARFPDRRFYRYDGHSLVPIDCSQEPTCTGPKRN